MVPEVHIHCVHMQFIVYVSNLLCTYAIYCVHMQFIVYISIYCVCIQFIVYICNLLCTYAIYCVHINLLCTYAIYCVCMQFIVYVCNLLCTYAILLPEKSTKLPFKRSTVITSDDIFVDYKVPLNFRMCRLAQKLPSTNKPQRPCVIAGSYGTPVYKLKSLKFLPSCLLFLPTNYFGCMISSLHVVRCSYHELALNLSHSPQVSLRENLHVADEPGLAS